jgi:hypothetical protein
LNIIFFEQLKKKFEPSHRELNYFFPTKIVTKLSKIWIWDPRPGIWKKHIPDQGVQRAPDPGSGTLHLLIDINFIFILFSMTMPLLLLSTFSPCFGWINTPYQVGSKLSTALTSGKLLM